MKLSEAYNNIGKRVKIPNRGDIAIYSDLRKYIYDEENIYYLVLERVTKGGRVIVRHAKETYSLAPKDIELFKNAGAK